ncbi:MAG: inorganic pyrophosphatase [Candidatus Hepatoplasma vulgare]|nr:MAG: inorganic pyrophosphatase [Candidatus Hepatoplasma sp.]
MKEDIVIEIPKGSNVKYEILNGNIVVDRILFGSMFYPENYGYFEETLDWDGDPLDAIVISEQGFYPKSRVKVRIIGAMKMIDGGETDTKIITVIDVDPRFDHIKKLEDIPKHQLNIYKDFFENYKNLQNKKVIIGGFENLEFALKEIKEAKELYKKYKNLDKKTFINKMRKEFPNKYIL